VSAIPHDGLCDLDLHSAPAPFRCVGTTRRNCAPRPVEVPPRLVAKRHFGDSAVKAFHAAKEVEGLHIFSGIALNLFVGGLNPVAVALALSMAAKMPGAEVGCCHPQPSLLEDMPALFEGWVRSGESSQVTGGSSTIPCPGTCNVSLARRCMRRAFWSSDFITWPARTLDTSLVTSPEVCLARPRG